MHLRPIYPSLCGGSLGVVGLDSSLKSLGVRANDLGYLVAVLEEEESRHGADAEFLGNIGDLVDVELVEFGGWIVVREPGAMVNFLIKFSKTSRSLLYNLGRDDLARPAPCREGIEDEEGVFLFEGLVEVALAIGPIASACRFQSSWRRRAMHFM